MTYSSSLPSGEKKMDKETIADKKRGKRTRRRRRRIFWGERISDHPFDEKSQDIEDTKREKTTVAQINETSSTQLFRFELLKAFPF